MIIEKRYCDNCDKEIGDYENFVTVEMKRLFEGEFEICKDCATKKKINLETLANKER